MIISKSIYVAANGNVSFSFLRLSNCIVYIYPNFLNQSSVDGHENEVFLLKARGGFPGGASGKEPACQCRRLKLEG